MKWEYPLTNYVYRRFSTPIARYLARFDVDPNVITILTLIIGLLAAFSIIINRYLGILLILVTMIFDCVDGDLARIKDEVSEFGAYLDSISDRVVDAAIIIALITPIPQKWFIGALALFSTAMVSYSRTKAEAEGAECKVGIATRDFRLLIVLIGLVIGELYYLLIALTILCVITVIQRIVHSLRLLR